MVRSARGGSGAVADYDRRRPKGPPVTLSPTRIVLVLLFVFVGFFGAAFAVSGVLVPLPAPAAGGTCGPSTASESALAALRNPASIGAGPEPPASNTAALTQWQAFVHECQSSADQRALVSGAILVLSIAVAVVGPLLVLRRKRSPGPSSEGSGAHGVPGGPITGWGPAGPTWSASDLVGQPGIGSAPGGP